MGNLIIVGADDSATALKAAEAAADLAVSLGRPLHVVTAFDEEETIDITVGSDRFLITSVDAAEDRARKVASSLVRDGLEVTSSARLGKPQDVIINEAKERDASIIVVGNRRMQGPTRLLGSVASSVAHHAPCDVYIVKTT